MHYACDSPNEKTVLKTCAYSAAKNANFVKWGSRVDLGNTSNMDNSVFTEGRGPNKMVYGLSIFREPCLAIIEHDLCKC